MGKPSPSQKELIREVECLRGHLIQILPDGVTIVDHTGRIIFANEAAERILGLVQSDLMDRTYNHPTWKITDPEGGPFQDQDLPFVRVIQTGQSVFNVEHAIEHPDGRRVLLSVNATPLRDAADDLTGMLATLTDITERRRAEQALDRSLAELKAIYMYSPVMICVLDADRGVLYANAAFTEFTGVTEVDLRSGRACGVFGCINALTDPRGCGFGQPCLDCPLRLALEDTLHTGKGHRNVEYRATLERNGVRRDVVLMAATALIQAAGQANLLLCLQDITNRKLAEAKMAQQVEELRRWHGLTLGRESRILDLKREVNELLVRAGQAPRYSIVTAADPNEDRDRLQGLTDGPSKKGLT